MIVSAFVVQLVQVKHIPILPVNHSAATPSFSGQRAGTRRLPRKQVFTKRRLGQEDWRALCKLYNQ